MYCNPPYFGPQSTSIPFVRYCKEQPVRSFKHFRAKLSNRQWRVCWSVTPQRKNYARMW